MLTNKAKTNYINPRYWPLWLGLGLLRLTIYLPDKGRFALAKGLGNLLFILAKRRHHITQVNVRLCFPELSQSDQKHLVSKIFYENALGILETALSFWAPAEPFRSRVRFENIHVLEQALSEGKGIVLVGAHYTTLDLAGLLFSLFYPIDVIYRPHDNPLLESVIRKARQRWAGVAIPKDDMRAVFRSLKQGHIFWYPADQDHGLKQSVFAPFFGITAATLTTPGRFAQANNSAVVVLGFHRLPDNTYVFKFSEPLDHYPSDDPIADATQLNTALEAHIRRYPEQYMWVHRRFKTRPKGEKNLYE